MIAELLIAALVLPGGTAPAGSQPPTISKLVVSDSSANSTFLSACAASLSEEVAIAKGSKPMRCLISPKGDLVLVTFSEPASRGLERPFIFNAGEKAILELERGRYLVAGRACWSNDGKTLAMLGAERDSKASPGKKRLLVFDLPDHSLRKAVDLPGLLFDLACSPDGQSAIVVTDVDGEDEGDLLRGDAFEVSLAKDSEPKRLTDKGSFAAPMWSPGGSRFVLVDNTRGALAFFKKNGETELLLDLREKNFLNSLQTLSLGEWVGDGRLVFGVGVDDDSFQWRPDVWYLLELPESTQ